MIYGYREEEEDFDVANVGNDGPSVNNYDTFVNNYDALEPFADLEPFVEANEGDQQLVDEDEDEEDLPPRRVSKTVLVEDNEGYQQLVDEYEYEEDLPPRRGWKTALVVAGLVLGFAFFVQFALWF